MTSQTIQHIIAILNLLINTEYKPKSSGVALKLGLSINVVKSIFDNYLHKYEVITYKRLGLLQLVDLINREDAPKLLDEIKEHGWPPTSLASRIAGIDQKAKIKGAKLKAKLSDPKTSEIDKPKPKQSGPYKNEPKQKFWIHFEIVEKWPEKPKKPKIVTKEEWKETWKGLWRKTLSDFVEALVKEKNIPYTGLFVKRFTLNRRDSPLWRNNTAANVVEHVANNILIGRLFGGMHEICGFHVNTREEMDKWTMFLTSAQKEKFTDEELSGPHPFIKEYEELLDKHPEYEGKSLIGFPIEQEQI